MEGVRPRVHGRPTVEFSVKGPVSIIIDEEQVTIPGCSILDINFKAPSEVYLLYGLLKLYRVEVI